MVLRVFQIAGSGPGIRWTHNGRRRRCNIEEAVAIAKANGVEIPDDVEFLIAQPGELNGSWKGWFDNKEEWVTAKGPPVTARRDGYIYWEDHYDPQTNTIRFWVNPEILTSDEGIVAVFTHELYELYYIRDHCEYHGWRMKADDYDYQTSSNERDTYHYDGWEEADKAVLRMRERKKQ